MSLRGFKTVALDVAQTVRRRTSRFELIFLGVICLGMSLYTSWSKGVIEGIWAFFTQGSALAFWVVYFGVIGWLAAVWARWDKKRADQRIIATNPCYVALRKDLADQHVSDVQVRDENGRWSRAIFFNPDVLLWCKDELTGDYTVHPAGPDGGRLVTFENPADAFAFKIRWG